MARSAASKKPGPRSAFLIVSLLFGAICAGPARAVAIDPTIAPTYEADIGVLSPGDEWVHSQFNPPGHFKDIYNFTIAGGEVNAFAAAFKFTAFTPYVIDDMALELYLGPSGSGALLASAALPELWWSVDLLPNDYSLFVLGYASGDAGGAYSGLLKVAALSPAAVPEPLTLYLLLAGLMGIAVTAYRQGVRPA